MILLSQLTLLIFDRIYSSQNIIRFILICSFFLVFYSTICTSTRAYRYRCTRSLCFHMIFVDRCCDMCSICVIQMRIRARVGGNILTSTTRTCISYYIIPVLTITITIISDIHHIRIDILITISIVRMKRELDLLTLLLLTLSLFVIAMMCLMFLILDPLTDALILILILRRFHVYITFIAIHFIAIHTCSSSSPQWTTVATRCKCRSMPTCRTFPFSLRIVAS
mmetsp:Transcript_1887/g.2241  ORF Transcript_1887/g.2241 Transcript_1887/m.2241 type:complete len:224 (-) Transcript_1887:907-1578(-)